PRAGARPPFAGPLSALAQWNCLKPKESQRMVNATACQPVQRKYYSITEAMILTRLARGTLMTAIKESRLKAYKPAPRRVVSAACDLDSLIRTNPVGSTEASRVPAL